MNILLSLRKGGGSLAVVYDLEEDDRPKTKAVNGRRKLKKENNMKSKFFLFFVLVAMVFVGAATVSAGGPDPDASSPPLAFEYMGKWSGDWGTVPFKFEVKNPQEGTYYPGDSPIGPATSVSCKGNSGAFNCLHIGTAGQRREVTFFLRNGGIEGRVGSGARSLQTKLKKL